MDTKFVEKFSSLHKKLCERNQNNINSLIDILHEFEEYREILSIFFPNDYSRLAISIGTSISNLCFDIIKHPKTKKLQHATSEQIKNGHIFFLAHRGGICNRLRSIAALQAAAHIIKFNFSFAWLDTKDCNGSPEPWKNFSNRISPFIKISEREIKPILLENDPVSAWVIYNRLEKVGLINSWQKFNNLYIEFSKKLMDDLIEAVNIKTDLIKKLDELKNYTALHIRRTDFVNYFQEKYPNEILPTIDDYIYHINLMPRDCKFFLSTDDIDTRSRFVSEFGDRVVYFDFSFDRTELRQTTFKHAILDLAMLSRANKLILTPKSSYSDYAASISNAEIIKPKIMGS